MVLNVISRNLKSIRIGKNYTQKEMACLLNISERTYRRYEKNGIDSIYLLEFIAEKLNININDLIKEMDKNV